MSPGKLYCILSLHFYIAIFLSEGNTEHNNMNTIIAEISISRYALFNYPIIPRADSLGTMFIAEYS